MQINKPKNKMNPKAKKAWIIGGIIDLIVYLLITLAFFILNRMFFELSNFITLVLLSISIILGIFEIIIIPNIRMYHWCYEISENEVDIQNGIIVIRRALIPMARIQHVDTERGPILRYFNLSTLSISTAGSTHKIPALHNDEALELRNKISKLAGVSEDDV